MLKKALQLTDKIYKGKDNHGVPIMLMFKKQNVKLHLNVQIQDKVNLLLMKHNNENLKKRLIKYVNLRRMKEIGSRVKLMQNQQGLRRLKIHKLKQTN